MSDSEPFFPPSFYMGYSLNMTAVTPNDIGAATKAIITTYRLVSPSRKTNQIRFSNVQWDVPDNINLAIDTAGSCTLDSWKDGQSAARDIKANASLSTKYMAVSGDASIGYSIDSAFSAERSYSLFSYNETIVSCEFNDWGQSVNKNTLATAISALNLQPFNPQDATIIASYRSLFEVLGSHIVVGCTCGGRLQMTIFASNKDTSYEDSMTADVSVQYNGLCTSGDIDVDVKSSDQYKSYSQEVSQSVSCRGGEDSLAISLNSGFRADDVYATFTNWAQTTAGPKPNPAVMSLQTVTLWDAMTATFDPNIIKHAPDVKLAYKWIMENPELYQTKCRFTINSDWGEFGITSPNAFVIQDPDHPPPTDNLTLTGTKVTWGNQHPHDFQPVTIDFIIVNDGSSVNFELSHGSDGASSQSGRVDVDFNGNSYTNKTITDNKWNTQFFYNASVHT